MSRRLGNHRCKPQRSKANRAKPELERLAVRIKEARARGEESVAAALETEREWLLINSLTS